MSGALPMDEGQATAMVEDAIREQVRASGKTNVSRAVSELVRAGLLKRHYQGYCVDHHNRGAQRQAVYVLAGCARGLIGGRQEQPRAVPRSEEHTSELQSLMRISYAVFCLKKKKKKKRNK